jgi:2-aminoadipate transaminase
MARRSVAALSALGQRTQEPPISWLMDAALTRPGLISLAAGFTDNPTLPVPEVRALLDELLGTRRTGEPALQYGNTVGLPELRRLSAERLRDQDGPGAAHPKAYSPDHLLITHGSQQFLYLITEVLCDPGDIVLLEDPTYFVFLGIAQSHGLECRSVRLDTDGIDIAHLDAVLDRLRRSGDLRRVKLLYLVTYYQNPTSTNTAFARKVAALELLRRYEPHAGHPLYLLEDAAYRELRFTGPEEPSALAAPGAHTRVIYTSTYSKPFATGIRVGYAWLPDALRPAAVRVKGNHDFGTSSLLQHLVARALATGRYAEHLAALRRRYAEKAGWLTAALRARFPATVRWREPRGGMYVWAALPTSVKTGRDSPLFRRALERNVLYVPGQLCYADDPTRRKPNHELRLSFGNATREQIERGITRLATALRQPRAAA